MCAQVQPSSLLAGFTFERILNEDPKTRFASILGHFGTDQGGREAAVLLLEKTHFSPSFYRNVGSRDETGSLQQVASLGSNDVYNWLLGWMPSTTSSTTAAKPQGSAEEKKEEGDAHVKLTLIRPATEAHIAKYSEQLKVMVVETPEIYRSIVKPYVESQPPERIQWVYNILDKKKEADTILYEKTGKEGYIIVPDLKWDRKTTTSLYLVAIVHDRSLRSIRDLKREHVPLLQSIRDQGEKIAQEKYGLVDEKTGFGKLRCFLHYQPTYYHLHVHLLSCDFTSHPGASVGQAHLLEDVVDLLEMGVDFEQRTLTYSLGEQNHLLKVIQSKMAEQQ
ncbi:hypothetical protein CBS101457_006140 [Exobasidium rhododendri]|nr:hypothetical protein CBS101457_006140 [Exobasidium rhododendri]